MSRNRTPIVLFVVLSILAFLPTQVFASAFGVRESSTVSTGMMHATTARLDTPETLFYNPAGLALLTKTELSIGVQGIYGSFNYSDPDTDGGGAADNATGTALIPIPNLSMAYAAGPLTVGLGVHAPYGLKLVWPEEFAGDHIVQMTHLKVPHTCLGVGFKVAKGLYLGVSGQVTVSPDPRAFTANVELEKDLGILSGDLNGEAIGFGGTVGLMYRPNSTFFVGLSYKSPVKLEFEGESTKTTAGDTEPFETSPILAKISMPDEINVGIGFKPNDDWYVALDAGMSKWSVLPEIVITDTNIDDHLVGVSPMNLEWGDGYFFRTGAQWETSETLQIRFGAGYEITPIPIETLGPLLPDSNRIDLSAGLTWKQSDNFAIDASLMYVKFLERTADAASGNEYAVSNPSFEGTYNTTAVLFGANFRYTF